MIPPLDDLVRLAHKYAERILIKERQSELIATYILFHPNKNSGELELSIVPCLWENDFQKQLMLLEVRKLSREIGAVALSFVSECWVAWRSKDRPRLDLPPSEDPQRREVVMACATDGKTTAAGQWQIVRDKPGGRIVSLVGDDLLPAEHRFEGRMIDGILPT